MSAAGQTDLFAVLGVPRRFALGRDELERCFHERSRLLHPDRFARATPAERRIATERAMRLNEAYRTLRDPWSRAEHLLALLGGEEAAPEPDAEFLEELLEVREALADARRRRDAAARAAIAERTRGALAALEAELARRLAGDAPDPDARASVRRALARARYHRSVLGEAEGAGPAGPAGAAGAARKAGAR